jgi:hypothetical protein
MQSDNLSSAIETLGSAGYAILPFKVDLETTSKARFELLNSYKYDSKDYNLNNRVENAWKFSPAVRKIATWPEILDLLNQYFEQPAFAFQTLNFERGSSQRLHSDFYHFASSRFEEMVGVWVALEDVHPDSGPLTVCPGTHRLPYLFPEDFGCARGSKADPYRHYKTYEDYVEQLAQSGDVTRKQVCLKEGEILVWHSNLMHGGSPIKDSRLTRMSQVTHYFSRGHCYFSPITSSRSWVKRSYRLPYDIATGRRVLPFA